MLAAILFSPECLFFNNLCTENLSTKVPKEVETTLIFFPLGHMNLRIVCIIFLKSEDIFKKFKK